MIKSSNSFYTLTLIFVVALLDFKNVYSRQVYLGLYTSINSCLLFGRRYNKFTDNQNSDSFKKVNSHYPGGGVGFKTIVFPLNKRTFIIDIHAEYNFWQHKTSWTGIYNGNNSLNGKHYKYEIIKRTGDVSIGIMLGYSILSKLNIVVGFETRFPIHGNVGRSYRLNEVYLFNDYNIKYKNPNIELIHYRHSQVRLDFPIRISYNVDLNDNLVIEPFILTKVNFGGYESYDFGYYGVVTGRRLLFSAGVSFNYSLKKTR